MCTAHWTTHRPLHHAFCHLLSPFVTFCHLSAPFVTSHHVAADHIILSPTIPRPLVHTFLSFLTVAFPDTVTTLVRRHTTLVNCSQQGGLRHSIDDLFHEGSLEDGSRTCPWTVRPFTRVRHTASHCATLRHTTSKQRQNGATWRHAT